MRYKAEILERLAALRRWLRSPPVVPFLVVATTVAIFIPPVYLFWAIQYSATLFPYWDHIATAIFLISYYDGMVRFTDLFGPFNEARPFVPRLLTLVNAILTDWDIRSEFSILYLAAVGVLVAHLLALRRLSIGLPALPFAVACLIISVLVCSPAGSHTQYASVMLLPVMSNLCGTIAMLIVGLRQNSWAANISAAGMAWLSAYSVTNGLLIFPVVVLVHQLASPKPFVLNRWSVFWLVNLVCIYVLYLATIPTGGKPPHPLDFIVFVLIYVGNPISSLAWYQLLAQTDPAATTLIPAVYGFLAVVVALLTLPWALRDLREKRPEAFILATFAGVAIAAAMLTAWGRAIGEYTVALASGSRYTIFGAYLSIGLVYYHLTRMARRWNGVSGLPLYGALHAVALCAFVGLSGLSYYRAIPIYTHTHSYLNGMLAMAYGRRPVDNEHDKYVFPSEPLFREVKIDMYRHRIGPYRVQPTEIVLLTKGPGKSGLALPAGRKVVQRVVPIRKDLNRVSVQLLKPQDRGLDYAIDWKVTAISEHRRQEVGSGKISTKRLRAWQIVDLVTPVIPSAVNEFELELSVAGNQNVTDLVSLQLCQPLATETLAAVEVDATPAGDSAVLWLQLTYDR